MKTKKLLALLLAVLMVMSLLPVGAMADDNLPTITYNGTEVAKLKKIGTFEETTMAGYTGDVYLASLPYGAEITSIDCPLSFRDETTDLGHNYFGSGSMCLMYDSDALVTIQDELIYDNQFTDADFIAEHTFGYDGYGDLYSWITFTEALPTEDVKGFAVYDADFGTWAGESGTIVFIQIATKEAQQSYSLDAGGVKITYSASKEGSSKQIGTFEETTMAGYTGDVYLASLPCGAEITSIDCPLSFRDETTDLGHNYFGSGSMCLMYDSDALVTIQDELIYDDQFTDADFIADHTFGYDGYGDLYGWITFTEDLPTEDVKGFAVYDADFGTWAGEGGTVVFIQISTAGESGSTTDKTALAAAISSASALKAEDYHTSGDRYNGKDEDTIDAPDGSFWADMLTALAAAQDAYTNSNDTTTVATATSNLADAISKLIPAAQVNATALYEAANESYYWFNGELKSGTVPGSTYISANNCTAASWTAYQSAVAGANSVLKKLYVTGELVNDCNNETTTKAISDATAALQTAVAGLDALAEPSDLKTAQFAYQQLTTLTRRVFQLTGLNQGAYTEDSWNRFQQAAEQATTFLSTHSEPTGTPGKSETQACIDAYTAFWKAGFETLAAKESGTATISIVDSYALRKGEAPAYKGVYSVDVPAGGITLGNALAASLGAGNTLPWNDAGRGIGVYLNGVYIYQTTISVENRPDSGYNVYSGVRLKGGDEVLVALMQIPTGTNLSGSVTLAPYSDVHSAIRIVSFVLDKEIVREASATAGTPVNLKAQYLCSSLMDYNGLTAPLAEAKVYVSEAFSTKAAAMEAVPDKDSGLVTGSDGGFSLTLSSATGSVEGWYAVTVLAQGENSGLSNGANLIVHVTDPDDLSGVKVALKAELEQVYTAYEDDFYSAAQLTQLAALYNNGISGIDAAANSGDAEAAYKAANDGIRAIQKANEIESATNFTAVQLFLNRLPSAEDLQAGKLYNVDKPVLDLLFGTEGYYTRMTEKQRSELSGAESAMLTALRKAYEDSNSGADLPALPAFTVTYEVRNADNGELVNLPLQSNSIGWDFYTFGGFDEDNGSINYRWHYEGDGASAFDDTSRTFTLPTTGAYMTTLNPGVNRGDYSVWDYATRDYYATNIPEHYQMENFDTFWIPRQNVTITYYVHAVDALAGARSTALNTLKTTYQGYKRSDYTAENWATLYQAYQDGVAAINAATTEAEINSARTTALNKMAAVQQKQKNQNGITGWGEGDAFDAGKKVGTVSIKAENTTFSGGAFTGTIFSENNYAIGENDNMMTVILRALADHGFTWEGTGGSAADAFDIGYLAKIKQGGQELGEFSGDPGSGWMGTLNDFMVNEGLNQFSVASGRLGDGDEIALVYTQNLGVDLGGSWGNSNTTLESLTVSSGRLIPSFESGEAGKTYDFALMISGSSANVVVTPHAANINYMVKTFLNEKVTTDVVGNSYYRRKEAIPVRPGDVIWVGCGERAWPSMNNFGAEARAYTGTWYALHVISADSGTDYVNEQIGKLPAVKESNYKDVDAQIKAIEAVIAQLNSGEKSRVNTTALNAVKEKIKFYADIDAVKTLLNELPKSANMSDAQVTAAKAQIEAAYAAYDKLSEEQRGYITVGDAKNYNELVDRLKELTPSTSAQTIVGSEKKKEDEGSEIAPAQVAVAPEVVNGEAKAEIAAEDVSKAIEEAPDAKTLTVKVETEGADKVEADLPAEAVKAAADAGMGVNVETENGTVKLSAADVKAASGKDLAVSVTENSDGSTTIGVTAGGKAVDTKVKVELPAKDGQVLVIVAADGSETVVKKSVSADGKVYAEIPAGSTVKAVDAKGGDFGDVKQSDWFAGAVEFVTSHGLFQGTGEGFEPGTTMNRAMLVTVLYRLEDATAAGSKSFADVDAGAWYADAAAWANENGIVTGTDKGFEPDAPVTREQIATILYRYVKTLGLEVGGAADLTKFDDGGKTSPWAKDAMAWAVSAGLFQGDDAGALNPGGEATRAQVATLLQRLVGLIVK